MRSTNLSSPQTLNLYAYCINDPVNFTDPSGLGFFSSLGKLFKVIGKVIKILAVILVVVVVVALVIYAAPAGSASFAEFLLTKLAPVLAKTLAGLTGFQMGGITLGPGGTPTWNPNGGGLRGIGGLGWDDTTDVITTTTNACKNGNPYPSCGRWYRRLARALAGGIGVAIALGHVAYQNLAAHEQRFGMWFLRRMDEGSPKVQIGTYANGEPIYMGFAVGSTRGSLMLPGNARVFTNHEAAFAHLQRYHGIDPRLASERLHQIKDAWGRGPAQNVLFDRTGGVWDPATGQLLGSLTQGGARRFR